MYLFKKIILNLYKKNTMEKNLITLNWILLGGKSNTIGGKNIKNCVWKEFIQKVKFNKMLKKSVNSIFQMTDLD